MIRLLLALAQGPQLSPQIVQDGAHALIPPAATYVLTDLGMEERTALLLSTVALPIAQQLYDRVVFGEWSWDMAKDIVTYQPVWAYRAFRDGKPLLGALLTVAMVGAVALYYDAHGLRVFR